MGRLNGANYGPVIKQKPCRVSQEEGRTAHASSDGAPCSSQLRNTAEDCARCQSESTSSAMARSGPLGVSPLTQRLRSHSSYVSGSGSCCTVSSRRVRFKDIPMASGVVFRLRFRRRPSETSRALRSLLQSSAGRTIDDLQLQYEAAFARAGESPIQSYQIELHRLQILKQQLESREPLQGCDRLEITFAGSTRLHLQHFSLTIGFQCSEAPVVSFAAKDAIQPRHLPLGRAAAAAEPPASIQPAPLGQSRPRRAYGAVPVLPGRGYPAFQLATT
jgi:hypothetical protein